MLKNEKFSESHGSGWIFRNVFTNFKRYRWKNCNIFFRILILHWEDVADKIHRNPTLHILRTLKVLLSIIWIEVNWFDRVPHSLKGFTFSTYRRDLVRVLRRQFWLTSKFEIVSKLANSETELISHTMSAKGVFDNLESDDFLAVKHGNQTNCLCHSCLLFKSDMKNPK